MTSTPTKPRRSAIASRRRPTRGFSLVEVLIVVALVGVLAGLFCPQMRPSVDSRLYAAAHVLAADLQHARSLAVANRSSYQLRFLIDENRYELSHAGANPDLDPLPPAAFLRQAVHRGGRPRQYAVLSESSGTDAVLEDLTRDGRSSSLPVQFSASGGLARNHAVRIWLSAGAGRRKRQIHVSVQPTTGAVRVGAISAADSGAWPAEARK